MIHNPDSNNWRKGWIWFNRMALLAQLWFVHLAFIEHNELMLFFFIALAIGNVCCHWFGKSEPEVGKS